MSWLTRATLPLLFLAVTSAHSYDEMCPKGYKMFQSGLCAMVTQPGTWLEAFSQCRLSDGFLYPSRLEIASTDTGIRHYLQKEKGVQKLWDDASDFTSVFTYLFISLAHAQLYSYHISRRKWSPDSTTECRTLELSKNITLGERSCSPKDSSLRLPYLCISEKKGNQFQTLSVDDVCTYGEFQRFEFDEQNACLYMDDELIIALAREWNPGESNNERNGTPCELFAQGIERTELETQISKACRLSDETTTTQVKVAPVETTEGSTRTTQFQTTTDFLNTLGNIFSEQFQRDYLYISGNSDCLEEITQTDEDRIENTRKSEVLVSFPKAGHVRLAECLLCAQSWLSRAPTPRPPLSIHLRNNGIGRLNLTLLNFDSDKLEDFTCYTDATLSGFDLSNYKMRTISIYPVNKTTNTRVIKLSKTVIEDSFFLRLRSNTPENHVPRFSFDNKKRLTEFSEGRLNEKDTFLTILFDVSESGNYWCVGTESDYSTNRPIFTEKVKVVIPDEDVNDRYLVLVETPREHDPDELSRETFGIVLARNLNVSDANFELKRITRNDLSYFLLYHVSLLRNHTILTEDIPRRFHFSVAKTNATAKITSIRKFNSSCSSKTLISHQRDSVDSQSTLTGNGRPGEVIPVNKTDNSVVNAVLLCVWDVVDGAAWKEVAQGDPEWKAEWNPESLESKRSNVKMITGDLKIMSENPVKSDELSNVTEIIVNLLNAKYSAPEDYKDAWMLLDKILSDLAFDKNGSGVAKDVRSAEVAILVSDLSRSDPVVGISFTTKNGVDSMVEVRSNGSFEENSELSVKLPLGITSKYKQLALTVFTKIEHFHSTKSSDRVVSLIVDIVLSNKSDIEQEPVHHTALFGETIEIFFKKPCNVSDSDRKCAFWDLQKTEWSDEGCTLDPSTNACHCNHLTHFAQIFTGSEKRSNHHQKALEIISIFGCSLSLFGMLVIAVTSIIFEAWRQEIGNKMLLNLTAALTLNLVTYLLFHFEVGSNSYIGCIVIGVVLHYTVLASFCWMFVMSGLQVNRLLTTSGNRTSKMLLKSSLFAWGLPCVPVGTLIIISLVRPSSLYVRTSNNGMGVNRGFCYPAGAAFYATVLAPISCIMIVNLVTYIAIMLRLYSTCGWGKQKPDSQRHNLSDFVVALRITRQLLFLFFLFGLPAAFSFLAEQHVFFEYLVCAAATLQGFVIFVFVFVNDNKSRGYWMKKFCKAPEKSENKITNTALKTNSKAGSNAMGTKPALFDDNFPLRNKENGSCVRIRNSTDRLEKKLTQEEKPLTLPSSSQQYGLPTANVSSQLDTDFPSKRISFERKPINTGIKLTVGVEMQILSKNKDRDSIPFCKTLVTDSESEASIPISLSRRDSTELSTEFALENESDRVVKDVVSNEGVASHENNSDCSSSAESEVQSPSHSSLNCRPPNAINSETKVSELSKPIKRSPFLATCQITRGN